ncbi:hypothetical protein Pyn_21969 [Prunus yedoensis var. nudiflora]|uniref:Uncharacterized protein n=1 Tax=Prunus yedoensis var. nudiflora TaxID=2094558 RepID=A0A314U962_PRUYE|nr:hypothetical protein Pyn_21969 [Prunus yedoensis var. nudiflora]
MYLTLATADKEVALARCQTEAAKSAVAEAQGAKEETKRKLGVVKEALAKVEWMKVEEVASART